MAEPVSKPSGGAGDLETFFLAQEQRARQRVRTLKESEVVWFPTNDLHTLEKPQLVAEEFAFEKLPLEEVSRRIYDNQFDFDKFLAQQLDSSAISVACCFMLGTIIGGAQGYYEAKEEVNRQCEQYRGQILSSKKVCTLRTFSTVCSA